MYFTVHRCIHFLSFLQKWKSTCLYPFPKKTNNTFSERFPSVTQRASSTVLKQLSHSLSYLEMTGLLFPCCATRSRVNKLACWHTVRKFRAWARTQNFQHHIHCSFLRPAYLWNWSETQCFLYNKSIWMFAFSGTVTLAQCLNIVVL